ncbi:MAG: folate-binding protein [Xanthomonadales bacterium]|nr:folate-binding protein [Xanthomonadales bacterium]
MQTRLIRSQLLQLHGPDAAAFIQAQVMSDSATLADGQWQWSGWLTAKGRLVAFFALYRQAADDWLLWLPAGGADALRGQMQRFVFRSKLTLQVREDLQVVGRLAPGDAAINRPIMNPDDDAAAVARLALDPQREAIILPGGDAAVDPQILARWYLADLAAGIAYIGAGEPASEQFVPQWLSLERLQAFSVKKGCYPGQEIVSRMHFLGQSKRAAFRLHGPGKPPPALAKVLSAEDRALGEIVWASADGDGWQALAVLNAEQADQVASVQDGDASTTAAVLA